MERIKNELNLHISKAEIIKVLNKNLTGGKDKYVFRVHNVGQALATSLSYENKPPFLYFDYGMPYGKNSSTRPPVVNMPTNPGVSIILSHVDKDHWFRVADDINAFQCHWYIPDQMTETDTKKQAVREAKRYILNNWDGIEFKEEKADEIVGCSAEGHVSHVFSERLSSRPKGWSRVGADQMARLRVYKKTVGKYMT